MRTLGWIGYSDQRERIARGLAEIAVSILAEIVFEHTSHPPVAATAIDPVCGMNVAITGATPHIGEVYFCCDRCRGTYAAR